MKERLDWLRRMPTKWRILLGSQALVFMVALRFRVKDINRSRELALQREAAQQQQPTQANVGGNNEKSS